MQPRAAILTLIFLVMLFPLACSEPSEPAEAGSASEAETTAEAEEAEANAETSPGGDHLRFTLTGPEIDGVTYSFDTSKLRTTKLDNMTVIKGMGIESEEGVSFTTLIMVIQAGEPGRYESADAQAELTLGLTPPGSQSHYSLSERYRDAETGIVIELERAGETLEGTFEGTLARTDKKGAREGELIPVYELEDGSFRISG